jgi:hypothetical protein
MRAALLRPLIERWGTPEAVVRAPSSELRSLGLPPAIVARVVAAPRQRAAAAAGLQSLERMGIQTISLLDDGYPRRLHDLPEPPLLLYAQGTWPVPSPSTAVLQIESPSTLDEELAALVHALHQLGAAIAAEHTSLALLPLSRSLGVVPYGLLLARSRVPDPLREAVAAGQATLLSVASVNAAPTGMAEDLARRVLLTLADGVVMTKGTEIALPTPRPDIHLWTLAGSSSGSIKRLRPGEAGARTIARAIGIRLAGDTKVTQERLW